MTPNSQRHVSDVYSQNDQHNPSGSPTFSPNISYNHNHSVRDQQGNTWCIWKLGIHGEERDYQRHLDFIMLKFNSHAAASNI